MTDPVETQQSLAHPLPDGVSDTFVRPCLVCGTTIHVVAGQEQPHVHEETVGRSGLVAHAWWQGFDAAKDGAQAAEAAEAETAALRARIEKVRSARGRRCNVCTGNSPKWDGHDKNPPCEAGAWELLDAALAGAPAVTPTETQAEDGALWCREHGAPMWEAHEECIDCSGAHNGSCHEAVFVLHKSTGPVRTCRPAPVADPTTGETR